MDIISEHSENYFWMIQEDLDTISEKLKNIQYVKIFSREDAQYLAPLYEDLGWRSSKYRKPLLEILDYTMNSERNFPLLVEYKDDFAWVEIGSFQVDPNWRHAGKKYPWQEKRMHPSIQKHTICRVESLVEMNNKINNAKRKYYILLS